jgi:uncharacterized membrane protein
MKQFFDTKRIARAGLIAGLYALLSLIIFPVASGAVQFRISEGLTMLALVFPEAVPALFIGCMISNIITGCGVLDVVLGSLITLAAAGLTYLVGKQLKKTYLKVFVGGLFPVLLNAFLLPLIWLLCYGTGEYIYILQVLFLLVGQSLSVYAIGAPLYLAVRKIKDI